MGSKERARQAQELLDARKKIAELEAIAPNYKALLNDIGLCKAIIALLLAGRGEHSVVFPKRALKSIRQTTKIRIGVASELLDEETRQALIEQDIQVAELERAKASGLVLLQAPPLSIEMEAARAAAVESVNTSLVVLLEPREQPTPEAPPAPAKFCERCGCTEENCSGCVERTGSPCYWVRPGLCSACATTVERDDYARRGEEEPETSPPLPPRGEGWGEASPAAELPRGKVRLCPRCCSALEDGHRCEMAP